MVLFGLFVLVGLLGLFNVYKAYKCSKLSSKSILLFYVSSLLVILLRIVLFTDEWMDYAWKFYVVGLITLPTFLYLITGLSQVMLSVECVFKYRNLEVEENLEWDSITKAQATARNLRVLRLLFSFVGALMVFILAFFLTWSIVCSEPTTDMCSFDNPNAMLGYIVAFNLIVLVLLICSTTFFTRTINKRFGSDFRSAKIRLLVFLGFFVTSFAVRAGWDTWQ